MFKVGDYVVNGTNGVCKVEKIGKLKLGDEESDEQYYTLAPIYTKGSQVFTPVDNNRVVLRSVISRQEACNLIDEMRDIDEIVVTDDKKREQAYKEAIKSCDCRKFISIINTVLRRREERLAAGKKMSACDERYFKQAKDNLYGEFAISLKIAKDDVESYVERRMAMKEMASAS